jgi:hypothetical protein
LLVAEEEGCAGLRDGFAVERERVWRGVAEIIPMATAVQEITLSPARDIPFSRVAGV